MKTIEEKAKAYDEARERAKKAIIDCGDNEGRKRMIYGIFPEMIPESEDERIRKHLIAIVELYWGKTNDPDKAKDLAYLEKQEQKPISAVEVLARAGLKPYKDGNQWCILAGDNIQEGICGFGDTIEDALYEFLKEILDLQKEPKPTPDWMPKFLDELRSKKNYFDWDEHRDIEGHILAIINWIDPNYFDRKEKEQKPACPSRKLSEDQIYTLERICSNLHLRASDDAPKLDEIIELLKRK